MVVRTRFRSLLIPAFFYVASAMVASYFGWHAINGQRGLKTRVEFARQAGELQAELDGLRAERARWAQKITLVRGETMDRDILDEQAHGTLGRAHKNELMVLLPTP